MDQMAEGCLIEIVQHVAQFFVARPPGSEPGSISLAQRGYERIAMFFADFAVLVSVTAVEAGFFRHDCFPCLSGERLPTQLGLLLCPQNTLRWRYSASNTFPSEPNIALFDAILISVGH